MRRRLMRSRVRPRRKTEWLSAVSGGCLTAIDQVRCDGEVLDPAVFTLIDNPVDAVPGEVTAVGEVTALRIVGSLFLSSFTTATTNAHVAVFMWHLGIYLSDSDANGAVLVKSPADVDDASSKDWLWRSTWMSHHIITFGGGSIIQSNVINGGGEPTRHIDIKVKRRLRKEETIILAVDVLWDDLQSGSTPATQNHLIGGDLRALVALP